MKPWRTVGLVPLAFLVGVAIAPACRTSPLPEVTHYPLAGAHRQLGCSDCHGDALGPLPTACAGCHEDDRPPDHYPGDCGGCHEPTRWDDAVVDHEQWLSLAGGHAPLICTDCHATDVFTGLDAACASCHEPDRPAQHFEGGCEGCHDVSGWGDATFDHRQFFPTPHHGVRACESCHPEPEGYAGFTCTDCHTHNQTTTDREHRGNSRYSYESAACLRCHPRGDD